MIDINKLREMTAQDLALLGSEEIVYVRPVVVEDETRFAVNTADGRPILVAPDLDTAIQAALEYDLEPVQVH